MRVCLAQLRPSQSLRGALERAGGADLVVFPELFLGGYAGGPDAAVSAEEAASLAGGATVLLGFHERDGDAIHNSAAYVERGSLLRVQRKLYLVGYEPFGEGARFAPGEELHVFDTELTRTAVLICNDAWQPFLPPLAVQDGAEILLVPAASSTAVPEAEAYWRELTRFYARMLECFVVFVNRVGIEGDFTFWGGSHVVDPLGEVIAEAPRMDESLVIAEIELERVAERRRALPLIGPLRPELLRGELARLGAAGRT